MLAKFRSATDPEARECLQHLDVLLAEPALRVGRPDADHAANLAPPRHGRDHRGGEPLVRGVRGSTSS